MLLLFDSYLDRLLPEINLLANAYSIKAIANQLCMGYIELTGLIKRGTHAPVVAETDLVHLLCQYYSTYFYVPCLLLLLAHEVKCQQQQVLQYYYLDIKLALSVSK